MTTYVLCEVYDDLTRDIAHAMLRAAEATLHHAEGLPGLPGPAELLPAITLDLRTTALDMAKEMLTQADVWPESVRPAGEALAAA